MGQSSWKIPAALAALLLCSAARPWTLDRFSQCVQRQGAKDLDPIETFSSQSCVEPDKVTTDGTAASDLVVDRFAFIGRSKLEDREVAATFMFRIDYSRVQTVVGGDAAGGLMDFDRLTILWGDGLQQYDLRNQQKRFGKCSSLGRGLLNTITCRYSEAPYLILTPEMLGRFKSLSANAPGTKLPIKLFSRSGETIEAYIYADEITATASAAGI